MVAGEPTGLPLVFHWGTPGAAALYPPMVEAATRRGLRTVVYSRAGYSESTPRPGRAVADIAGDVTAILAALGADTFVTAGWSGGGPHALACASLLPGRCLAAVSIAGVAPFDAEGLEWTAGMGAENIEEFGAAISGEPALTPYLLREAEGLAGVQGPDVAQALGDLVSDVDRRALTGEFAEFLAASFRKSVSGGIAGWRDDDLAFVRDWGFPLPGGFVIEGAGAPDNHTEHAPVALWQGDQDRMVPFAHGEWLAAHLPDARVHLLPDQGHLSLVLDAYGEILDDLLDLAQVGGARSIGRSSSA
jgi:pimeloyl-ACP methyl ester carboxylesterase